MELTLRAPFAGDVTEVGAATGEQVAPGATLFVVTPDETDGPARRPDARAHGGRRARVCRRG